MEFLELNMAKISRLMIRKSLPLPFLTTIWCTNYEDTTAYNNFRLFDTQILHDDDPVKMKHFGFFYFI